LSSKDVSGPVTTESEIEHQLHGVELVGITRCTKAKVGIWLSPGSGVRGVNVLGDVIAGEEIGRDMAAGPFQCIYTSLTIVERSSVGSFRSNDSTALVGILVGSIDIAVDGGLSVAALSPDTGEVHLVIDVHDASIAGVESGGVDSIGVDTLDDIDLTSVGPVGSNQPPCWPGSTSSGHVVQINNEQSRVPGLSGGDSDGFATSSRSNVGRVRLDQDLARSCRNEASSLGIGLREEVHISMGGVPGSEEIPASEEVSASPVGLDDVCSRTHVHTQEQGK